MSRVKAKQQWILVATAVLAAVVFGTAMHRADAARAVSVSPQGKVAQVRQVVVKFDEAMIAFGSPGAQAPAKVQLQRPGASCRHGALDRRENLGLRFRERPSARREMRRRPERRPQVRRGRRA